MQEPWRAGMVVGASAALGCLILALHQHVYGDVRINTAVGAATAFVVGSLGRGARNQRKANGVKPDPPWPTYHPGGLPRGDSPTRD
jgi:hypothetical protein